MPSSKPCTTANCPLKHCAAKGCHYHVPEDRRSGALYHSPWCQQREAKRRQRARKERQDGYWVRMVEKTHYK